MGTLNLQGTTGINLFLYMVHFVFLCIKKTVFSLFQKR